MSPEVWKAILTAWDTIGQRIDQTLPSGQAGLAAKPGDDTVLARLGADLGHVLADLAATLERLGISRHEVKQALDPLAMVTDERVLMRVPTDLVVAWGRLYRHPSADGGVVFFHLVDALLRSQSPSTLALEVHHFCLAEGFCGTYAEDRPRLDRYEDALRRAILATEGNPDPTATTTGSAPAQSVKSSLWDAPDGVYAVAAAAVALALAIAIPVIAHALL